VKKTLKNMLYFSAACIGLPVAANVVPSSPILVTLMMEALSSSDTLVLTRATFNNIPEDAILHSHSCENIKSYITSPCLTLALDVLAALPKQIFLAHDGNQTAFPWPYSPIAQWHTD
jgi:hypothetical protein